MLATDDIIAAPATASGGALGIVRVSGAGSVECCAKIFRSRHPLTQAAGYTAHYGSITDARGETIDDVIVTVFRAPHSFTGEDAVEISHHGSQYIAGAIMRRLVEAGARTASAGEFSARAFLAGKLDLAQAEAIAEVIASDTQWSHALAASHMKGTFSDSLHSLREDLLHTLSMLELELDFGEEEVEFANREQIRSLITELNARITHLRDSFRAGNAIKEGVAVVIAGAPNVGKSTLLNRLTEEDRAMVSDIAGTTRDTIEASTVIDGVKFRFTDTAGLHDSDDMLERMGIERTRRAIQQADIILHVTTPETFASERLETSTLGQLDTAAAGQLDTDASECLETATAGRVDTAASGQLETVTAGRVDTAALGLPETAATERLETTAAEHLDTVTAGRVDTAAQQQRVISVVNKCDTAPDATFPDAIALSAKFDKGIDTPAQHQRVISVVNKCDTAPDATYPNAIALSAKFGKGIDTPAQHQRVISVVNKCDTAPDATFPNAIAVSAKFDKGIDTLRHTLRAAIDTQAIARGEAVVSSARHYAALTRAAENLAHATATLDRNAPTDLLSEDLRAVADALGEITGEITSDDILRNIFSKFCIGK